MSTAAERLRVGELLAPEIVDLLRAEQYDDVRAALLDLHDAEITDVLRSIHEAEWRIAGFRLLPPVRAAEVFARLSVESREPIEQALSFDQLAQLFEKMAVDDRAAVFEKMAPELVANLLARMKPEERGPTQMVLDYPAQSVGRIMTPRYLAIQPPWSCGQVLDHIRQRGREAETLQLLLVVDSAGHLVDDVRISQVLLADPSATVESLMNGQYHFLHATEDREVAVRMMQRYDYPVLPVVDENSVLLGVVTFDDVADVAAKETTEDIQKMGAVGALDEPYLHAPLWTLIRKRAIWLSVLFLGETLTATAMAHFQIEIEKASVLALFIPLIISSGGNSGSQASTLVIRSMAVGEVRLHQWSRVLRRELMCGLILGSLLGIIGVVRINLWQYFGWVDYNTHHGGTGDFELVAMTVSIALVGVVTWGTLMGSMLPFILRALRLDPAVISAPLVATLVDVTGLVIYFTTALVILKTVMS